MNERKKMRLKVMENELPKDIARDLGRKSYIPKGLDRFEFVPQDPASAGLLFKGFFNNKMTIILLMLQKKKIAPDSLMSLKAVTFFEDLYHHMLPSKFQTSHRRVFQWLTLFFRRFPYVKPVQKRKAIEYLGLVYQMFGLKLDLNI